jgi:hypothetical protein
MKLVREGFSFFQYRDPDGLRAQAGVWGIAEEDVVAMVR